MRAFFFGLLFLWTLAKASLAAAHPPYGLAADPAGNVYFSDLEAVWRLTPDGSLSIFRPAVPGRHVHALAMAPDGAVEGDQNHYDPETQRFYTGLWRRTLAGAERDIVPMTDRPPPGAGVWQDEPGNRYVTQWISSSDRRMILLRRRPHGGVEVLFNEAGGAVRPAAPSVESVGGVAFGGDGSLFFADRRLLRRRSQNGTVSTIYEGRAGSSLRGLAMAPDGRVLAADMGAKAVLAVAADGTVETLYQENDDWSPTAIAFAGERLLVLEANADPYERADRVRVIEVKDGRGAVVAQPARPRPAQTALPPSPPPAEGHWPNLRTFLLASLAASAAVFAAWRFRSLRGPET